MPDVTTWLLDTEAIDPEPRAVLAWRRINDKPSSVSFRTAAGATLAAQTVRLEHDSRASQPVSAAGPAAVRAVTIFGVRQHPTVTDTNVAAGYRFILDGEEYRVVDVVKTLGEVQAYCEAVG